MTLKNLIANVPSDVHKETVLNRHNYVKARLRGQSFIPYFYAVRVAPQPRFNVVFNVVDSCDVITGKVYLLGWESLKLQRVKIKAEMI